MLLSKCDLQEGKAQWSSGVPTPGVQVCEAAGLVSKFSEVIINEDQADRESQQGWLPPGNSIISASPGLPGHQGNYRAWG